MRFQDSREDLNTRTRFLQLEFSEIVRAPETPMVSYLILLLSSRILSRSLVQSEDVIRRRGRSNHFR